MHAIPHAEVTFYQLSWQLLCTRRCDAQNRGDKILTNPHLVHMSVSYTQTPKFIKLLQTNLTIINTVWITVCRLNVNVTGRLLSVIVLVFDYVSLWVTDLLQGLRAWPRVHDSTHAHTIQSEMHQSINKVWLSTTSRRFPPAVRLWGIFSEWGQLLHTHGRMCCQGAEEKKHRTDWLHDPTCVREELGCDNDFGRPEETLHSCQIIVYTESSPYASVEIIGKETRGCSQWKGFM